MKESGCFICSVVSGLTTTRATALLFQGHLCDFKIGGRGIWGGGVGKTVTDALIYEVIAYGLRSHYPIHTFYYIERL